MAWLLLVIAGVFEVIWAIALKSADGFTRFWPSMIAAVGIVLSMVCLTFALRDLPVGTAYAVWTGIGAIGTVILGIAFFGESMAWTRLLFIGLIFSGIVGLKISS